MTRVPHLLRGLGYSDVMATVAVFVGLGGSSYAVVTGSVGSRQLKNNDIRSKDVRDRTLAGRDVKDNALTGADVRESTLQIVPVASAASRADAADRAARADRAGIADAVAAPEGLLKSARRVSRPSSLPVET